MLVTRTHTHVVPDIRDRLSFAAGLCLVVSPRVPVLLQAFGVIAGSGKGLGQCCCCRSRSCGITGRMEAGSSSDVSIDLICGHESDDERPVNPETRQDVDVRASHGLDSLSHHVTPAVIPVTDTEKDGLFL